MMRLGQVGEAFSRQQAGDRHQLDMRKGEEPGMAGDAENGNIRAGAGLRKPFISPTLCDPK